ncbi:MAG: ChaN family lipoprotein [Planctomycetaceae bacterium]|nr:ChaN family lipoprotein [Planctomycetaceae bacterium]
MPLPHGPRYLVVSAAIAALPLLSGCSTRYFASDPSLAEPSGAVAPRAANAPRALFMFEGSSGRTLGWGDVMAAASWADVVFIGERHDDPTAHAVQLAVYQDLVAGYPGTAIALEHLERNEQATVDRYLRGEITRDEFIDATKSRDWAGKDTWLPFFQPLVDSARENGAPVVAANAPRDVVRRARSDGHATLAATEGDERAWFEVPVVELDGFGSDDWNARWQAYATRFREIMSGEGDDPHTGETRARLDNIFLSQSVWDGTMGDSAAKALAAGAPKVVLCAGCFHIERDGGTVLQCEARARKAKVLTITVIDDSSDRLRDADRGAADIVIYGFPVVRKKRDAEPEMPAGAPESTPAPTPAPTSEGGTAPTA